MITGIIFACMVEEAICQPMTKEFNTVQECILDTTETIKKLEVNSGIVFYAICDPDSKPV